MVHTALLILALAAFGKIRAVPIGPFPRHNISSSIESLSAPPTCDDIDSCRTLWDIIYSCVFTIFACIYLALHPNVPDPTHTQWRIHAIRVCSAFIAFLAPELVVVGAASQWWAVRKDKTSFQGRTRRHSYFTVMGGFYKSGKRLKSLSSLDADLYPELLKKEDPTRNPDETSPHPGAPLIVEPYPSKYQILVTESEILDKSKSDPLGKLFTVLQTTWFVAQYLERWVTHQPRTQLEVMTLAYAALNILVYALWWDKPLNVQEVINVGGRASASVGRTEGISSAWDIIDNAGDSITVGAEGDIFCASVLLPAVGILFGGVHCLAWSFPFPTSQEKVLWRVCTVYCTASPFIIAAGGTVFWAAEYDAIPWWIKSLFRSISNCIAWLLGLHPMMGFAFYLIAFSPMIFYVICRIILVVLTFTSLRAPPPGVFAATSWTSFFPHFG